MYYIKNHMLEYPFRKCGGWYHTYPMFVRTDFADKARVKVCKYTEGRYRITVADNVLKDRVEWLENLEGTLVVDRLFTQDEDAMCNGKLIFRWVLRDAGGRSAMFDGKLLGWLLYREERFGQVDLFLTNRGRLIGRHNGEAVFLVACIG